MQSSSLLAYSLVSSRVGIRWFFVPSPTAQCMWFSLREVNTPWQLTFYPFVTTQEPAHGLALSRKSINTLLINNC